jgi:hypothetical protein
MDGGQDPAAIGLDDLDVPELSIHGEALWIHGAMLP